MKVSIENGLLYQLNEQNHTACIGSSNKVKGDIFIPQKIIYYSQEFNIVALNIYSLAYCHITSVTFPENSFVSSFNSSIFFDSKIQSLNIPASLTTVNKEWCRNTNYLTNIVISPQNKKFAYIDDDHKLIGYKSDPKSGFDTLLFACRDIKQAVIPPYIKRINAYAFQRCNHLISVTFSEDSQLISVGDYSFEKTIIQSIIFPKKLKYLGKDCFYLCYNLEKVGFEEPSMIETINGRVFQFSSISSLYLPSSIKRLDPNWCFEINKLDEIIISPKNKNLLCLDQKLLLCKSDESKDSYDTVLFCCRGAHMSRIPSFIKNIGPYAFDSCTNLKTINFTEDSQLQNIGESAFSRSGIEYIFIPSSLSNIASKAFKQCNRLVHFIFPIDSQIKEIKSESFLSSLITELFIPKSVKKLESGWCSKTNNLEHVYISSENENFVVIDDCLYGRSELASNSTDYDVLLFANRKIQQVDIPNEVKFIDNNAFEYCINLLNIEISKKSKILVIGESAFAFSQIRSIFIPKNVKEIKYRAFSGCSFLDTIEIDEDSQLESFNFIWFNDSSIKKITIPSYTKKILSCSFGKVSTLKEIVISPKNKDIGYLDDAHKIIGCRSNESNKVFDVIVNACCDIKEAFIPAYVRKIKESVFAHCFQLKSIEFDDQSLLEEIKSRAFYNSSIESIIIPKCVSKIDYSLFSKCTKIRCIEFLNDDIFFSSNWIDSIQNPLIVSFPNAFRVFFKESITSSFPENTQIFTNSDCQII